MKLRFRISVLISLCCLTTVLAGEVTVATDSNDLVQAYAIKRLEKAFAEHPAYPDTGIHFAIDKTMPAESYRSTVSDGQGGLTVQIYAGDSAGLLYGSGSLLKQLGRGVETVVSCDETAHFPFRAIKFNLPWQSYRKSDALALHGEVCRDLAYWEAFLDMMAENRFNVLTLWNLHPFNLMIRNEKYPEACGLSDAELAEWQAFWNTLFKMAKERGIDTYMVTWNIFVSPEFAKAHDVVDYCATDMDAHYIGPGDASELIKDYMRTSVTQLIDTYPDLTGLGTSLGERMKGQTAAEREQWVMDTYGEGLKQAKRKARFIHRLPFSATADGHDSNDLSCEQLTRNAIESMEVPEPVWVEAKYNWSHAFSTPKLVHVHGGKLKDTYWNPPPTNYKVTWMARNEDFFALRWAQPDFIREHIKENNQAYVGGYYVGSECYIPAVDYFTKKELSRPWTYAFERQWMFYNLWGNLLYNPKTPDTQFVSDCLQRLGTGGDRLFEAQKIISKTPLRIASFYHSSWDYTLYSEGLLSVHVKNKNRFITVDELIKSGPLDPGLQSIRSFVQQRELGASDQKRTSPLALADWMEADSANALKLISSVKPAPQSGLAYEVADVKAWAAISAYMAEKIRGAVALHTFRTYGDQKEQEQAVEHLKKAAEHWKTLVAVTDPIYGLMPLGHLKQGEEMSPDWHWSLYQEAVDQEIETARSAVPKN